MPKGVEHHHMHRLPDELDGLLRAYFRAEMPHPWPSAPCAAPPCLALPSWRRFHGRMALAAAVAFFLVGSFALTQSFPAVKEKAVQPYLEGVGPDTAKIPKRPHSIDLDKTRGSLQPFKADLPRMQMLPLVETPSNRSFGVWNKNGKTTVIVVGEEKKP